MKETYGPRGDGVGHVRRERSRFEEADRDSSNDVHERIRLYESISTSSRPPSEDLDRDGGSHRYLSDLVPEKNSGRRSKGDRDLIGARRHRRFLRTSALA